MSRRDLLFIPPLLFFGAFYLYPLGSIIQLSLAPEGRISWEAILQTLQGRAFWKVLGFTVGQATLSMMVTLALGLPLAGLFARYPFPGRWWWQAMATVPFVLPTVVVAAAFTALLGPWGWINPALRALLSLPEPPISFLNTLAAIVVAHVFYNLTLVLRIVGTAWAHLDPTLEMAARTLGADRWRSLGKVRIPLLMPAILAATALVFLFDFASFGVVLLLGGPRYATLEVEIYRQALGLFNLPAAATLSLVQLGLTFGILALYTRLQARLTFPLEWRPAASTIAPIEAIRNSLIFATAVMALSLLLGGMVAYRLAGRRRRRWLDPLLMLPLSTSAVTLGFGFLSGFSRPPAFLQAFPGLSEAVMALRASPLLVVIAHTLIAYPFLVRILLPAMEGMNPRWREAAMTLGASPWRVWWRVEAPLLGRALLTAAIFAFCVSLGGFGATALIARPTMTTMPLAIARFLSRPGELNLGQAMAMSTLLLLVTFLGILLIERFRYRGIGGF